MAINLVMVEEFYGYCTSMSSIRLVQKIYRSIKTHNEYANSRVNVSYVKKISSTSKIDLNLARTWPRYFIFLSEKVPHCFLVVL